MMEGGNVINDFQGLELVPPIQALFMEDKNEKYEQLFDKRVLGKMATIEEGEACKTGII